MSKNKNKNKKKKPEKPAKYKLLRCRREEYIRAWNEMYKLDKKKWNDPMYDGVNPALNKTALATEINNICAVMFDTEVAGETENGKPIGIFSMVITKDRYGKIKPIGKQFVVDSDYQKQGLGSALLLELEKWLKELGYTWYYIGCSHMSASIERSLGAECINEDVEHDLYKFNVDLTRYDFNEQYKTRVTNNKNIKVIRERVTANNE